jgi:hypothetical protein
MYIPSSVNKIEPWDGNNPSFIVDADNQNYSSQDGILFNKGKDALILCPKSKQGSYVIPSTVTSIKEDAFAGCSNLTSVIVPSSVTSIGGFAFNRCTGLTSILIPSTVISITYGAFMQCSNLTSITIPSSFNTIPDAMFSGCTKLTSITIPSAVAMIGSNAFYGCSSLTSINIPSSVKEIYNHAFDNCFSLTTIYCYASTPPMFPCYSFHCNNFFNVDKETCVLYVPFGSKVVYASAPRWQEFKNIVEMPGTVLTTKIESKEGSKTTIDISSNIAWKATSNQPWLTVSLASGTGNQTLTFTANANTQDTIRTAIVTVSSEGIDPQIIIITQEALITDVSEIVQNIAQLTCYPNPFTDQVSIEIHNPKHIKLTVDIYNMAGQLVKNLAIGNPSELLNLTWDGTNDQGQQVPPGVYICKMNRQTMQIVKGR